MVGRVRPEPGLRCLANREDANHGATPTSRWVLTSPDNSDLYREHVPDTLIELAISCGLELYSSNALSQRLPPLDLRPIAIEQRQEWQRQKWQRQKWLFAAARGGCTKLAETILNSGPIFDPHSRWTGPCLARAIVYRRFDTAKLFIKQNADLYHLTHYMDTCGAILGENHRRLLSPMEFLPFWLVIVQEFNC